MGGCNRARLRPCDYVNIMYPDNTFGKFSVSKNPSPFSLWAKPEKHKTSMDLSLQTLQAAMNYQPQGQIDTKKDCYFFLHFLRQKKTLYAFFRIILVHVFYVRVRRTKFMFAQVCYWQIWNTVFSSFLSHHITQSTGYKKSFFEQMYPVEPPLALLTTSACHSSGKMAKVTKIYSPGWKKSL